MTKNVVTKIERVRLPDPPGALAAASPAGPVYVMCGSRTTGTGAGTGARAGAVLHAVDLAGKPCWSRPLGPAGGGMPRVAPDGGIWSADGAALVETTPSGTPGRRVVLASARDEFIGAFVVLPDGFLVAWAATRPTARSSTRPAVGARVERTDGSGVSRWSAALPTERFSLEDAAGRGHRAGGRAGPVKPWRPRELGPEYRAGLLVSADRVLATYVDLTVGIGVGFCLDRGTGEVVWATPPHPTGERAIAGPGRFLVGTQGYGAFSTWSYDRDGAVLADWPSQGPLLVSGRGRIRVLETDNGDSTNRRVRRLHRDGGMTDGPRLPGYYTAGPVLSGDGRAAFWRDGALRTVDPELRVQVLHRGPGEGVGRMLLMDGGRLFFVLTGDWARGDSVLVIARTDLPPLDAGAWPCGEGGLHGNPVLP